MPAAAAIFPYRLNKTIFGPHNHDKPATNVIINRVHKLAYVPIPKNACTAIKILFFSLNKGSEFKEHFSAIHGRFDYRAIDFDKFAADNEYFKFVVVRDPVERFVSAYNNRVKMYGELSEKWLKAHDGDHKKLKADFGRNGLSFNPEINEFASRIAEYANASTNIKHHFVPQHLFFNSRLDVFHKVYNIRQLRSLTSELSGRVGEPLELRNVQETKGLENAARVSDLTTKERAKVTAYYAKDYELLTPYLEHHH